MLPLTFSSSIDIDWIKFVCTQSWDFSLQHSIKNYFLSVYVIMCSFPHSWVPTIYRAMCLYRKNCSLSNIPSRINTYTHTYEITLWNEVPTIVNSILRINLCWVDDGKMNTCKYLILSWKKNWKKTERETEIEKDRETEWMYDFIQFHSTRAFVWSEYTHIRKYVYQAHSIEFCGGNEVKSWFYHSLARSPENIRATLRASPFRW